MRRVAFLVLSAVMGGQAWAGPVEDGLAACVREVDDAARLACFDALGRGVVPLAPEPPRSTASPTARVWTDPVLDPQGRIIGIEGWVVSRGADPMTDRPRTMFLVSGAEDLGRSSRRPDLVIRCDERGLDVMFIPGTYIGSGRQVPVTYRFDQQPAVSQSWNSASNGSAAFAPSPRAFAAALGDATRLLIEATSFNGERYRGAFMLKGIEALAAEINACRPPGQPARRR